MNGVTATAEKGDTNYAVHNHSSTSTMNGVTATASEGTTGYGVYNESSTVFMTGVTVTASSRDYSYGVYTRGTSTVKIDSSVISGSTNTVNTESGSFVYIGATRLHGGDVFGSGSNVCAGVYDESYKFYTDTCP